MAHRYAGWPIARVFACLLALVTTLFVSVAPVRAADQVVTQCGDDDQFGSLLAGGGTITFNCGTALIHLNTTKTINAETTIDGGGTITLSGAQARQLFTINAGSSLTLRNIVLTDGFSSTDGGAISNNGALTLENSTIRNSHSDASGGAIVSFGPLTIINSLLEGNWALNGGALYPRWSAAQTTIVGSVLRNNQATDTTYGFGGAILAWDGAPITIQGTDINDNRATQGGAIYNNYASVSLERSTLYSNSARLGGVLFNRGTTTLSNTTLTGNQAGRNGGGIYNFGGTATLNNTTLSGNSATQDGGGIYNFGSTMDLTNVTLSGNSAAHDGGGIYNDGSTTTLTNVTLSGNAATHYGGGIYHYSAAGHTLSLKNTIVANSPSGRNCYTATNGLVATNDANLTSDQSYCPAHYRQNVLLGPLAYNGGPTLTHMPQIGSPAINHGLGCPASDQRGGTRPADPSCDIGAVEVEALVQP